MSDILEKRPKPGHSVSHRVYGERGIVLTHSDQTLHRLNPVATRIWQLADGTRAVREIAEELVREFGVDGETALRDTIEFVELLVSKNMMSFPEDSEGT